MAAGIETDRGPWVAALIAAGYAVFPVNPLQASRYRERHGVPGAKSDGGGAHMLADTVRTDSHRLRPAVGDSPQAEGIKVVARMHKTMIWECTRGVRRLRHQLREYFPAALAAFGDLDAPDALELPGRARDPSRAAKLTRAQILAALRGGQLGQPPTLTAAYSAAVRSLIAVITTLNEQVKAVQGQVEEHFGRHPDAEACLSQPGVSAVPGAQVPGESDDDPHRHRDGKARKNYTATSPLTRASGKKKVAAARFIHTDRLADAPNAQSFAALKASPGARAFCDALRARGIEHDDALRWLANRLAGILHRCLRTRTCYDEAAWSHRVSELAA